MSNTNDLDMRESIRLVEELLSFYSNAVAETPEDEDVCVVDIEEDVVFEHPILEELRDAAFVMKSIMESSGGDYAFGFEQGMSRAAEMIEIIIRRHTQNGE